MSDAPPATPVDKNKQRLRKNIFGFFNIFGFNTETSDIEFREDIPPDANIGSGDSGSSNSDGSQNNSRRTSISRENCGEAASQLHGKQPERIVKGSKGRGNTPVLVAGKYLSC
ncbi:hypothetical protein GGF37_001671 [Kickxella alabastrina]|nr:hypothetical protein GGF37_001671 [Kickxella alabastrina]